MNIKKLSYSMNDQDFNEYLKSIKKNKETIKFFNKLNNDYFYCPDIEINNLLLKLHSLELEFNNIINNMSKDQISMIEQSFIIDEIQSTNNTENIYSTKNDIFGILNNKAKIKKKKIVSIINSYNTLLKIKPDTPKTLKEIAGLYNQIMENAYESKKDKPDGKFFRKGHVYISDGIKQVHKGYYPEEKINDAMEDFVSIINNDNLDIYLKILISHFMIETIHPYYDGNGRFGRYLMTLCLYNKTNTLLAYKLATGINNNKNKYYKALEIGRDYHSYGCINEYIIKMINILIVEYKKSINTIIDNQNKINNYKSSKNMTKSEQKIFNLILNATFLTYFGICNEEIIEKTHLSKKTIITFINKMKKEKIIVDQKIGKTYFHKFIAL